jgi:hypothetical protein
MRELETVIAEARKLAEKLNGKDSALIYEMIHHLERGFGVSDIDLGQRLIMAGLEAKEASCT